MPDNPHLPSGYALRIADLAEPRRGRRCETCQRVTWNPSDVEQGYCGACHDWTPGHLVQEKTIAQANEEMRHGGW